jgi:hypothetical protein
MNPYKEKKMKKIIALSVVIFVLLLSVIANFLALHDIRNDYINTKNIGRFVSALEIQNFPTFSSCPYEWGILQISFIFQMIVIIALVILLLVLIPIQNGNKQE